MNDDHRSAPEGMPHVEGVSFRREAESDIPFLRQAFSTSRDYELDLVQWEPDMRHSFLMSQFDAQRFHYTTHYPHAGFYIMEINGAPMGRVYVDLSSDPLLLMDIIVLPSHRNKGIGTAVMRAIMALADQEKKRVRIYVEKLNPALRLYQRLGFVTQEDTGPHYLMYHTPPGAENVS
ncbi:MAG: GNAT family N-acetyltransferase [Nitrospinota bacterium]|nr:GNAT family N-acetyltransferase [Nitrospinota bacterium]